MASSIKSSSSSGGDLETLAQQAPCMRAFPSGDPPAVVGFKNLPEQRSCKTSSTSSVGDLETLAQQALQCNCVVAACIGNKDLETLTLQALPHDLMASSFTQSTTQSTVAQQSSQAATVLQARQPEKLGLLQGCQEMHFNTKERHQQALRHNRMASSVVISISSRGDLETLPQQALPHNQVASSIKSSTSRGGDLETFASNPCLSNSLPRNHVASSFKSSTSSGGDLETLAQQALQCNCVVVAYIGNKI
ncbi:hypothetical protein AAY473_037212 [Plecturocebus cupreus]